MNFELIGVRPNVRFLERQTQAGGALAFHPEREGPFQLVVSQREGKLNSCRAVLFPSEQSLPISCRMAITLIACMVTDPAN